MLKKKVFSGNFIIFIFIYNNYYNIIIFKLRDGEVWDGETELEKDGEFWVDTLPSETEDEELE